ncbi:MAG: hypothetical protein ACFFCW_01990 [Candidatus Hodarchaeota archaeon]
MEVIEYNDEKHILRDPRDTTYDMVLTEQSYWRECSGNKTYSVEALDEIFQGFLMTAYRAICNPDTTEEQKEFIRALVGAINLEHAMRQAYRSTQFIYEATEELKSIFNKITEGK